MNVKWIIAVLVVAMAGVVGFGVSRYAACRTTGAGIDRLRDVMFLQRELNLTDLQVSQIRDLHGNLATRLDDCSVRHCSARMRLGQALAEETNGSARADALLVAMCKAYEESERAALSNIRQVRTLLDSRQRIRFDALLSACLCACCSNCQTSCGCVDSEGDAQ